MEIRKLNALRGLAALIVFITHFSDATNWLNGIFGGASGQYGVMLFFMLSGFLMSYLYFEKAFNKKNIQDYFLARVGRILPLYLLVVFSSYVLTLTGGQGLYEIANLNSLIAHLIFVYGEGVLWTISPEMQFYLAFAVFWCFASNRIGYIYTIVVAVLLLLFFTNFPRLNGNFNDIPYNFFHVFRSLPYFFVGLIFGMHYKVFQVPNYLKKNWFILALFMIPLMFPHFSPITSDAKNRMWLSYEVLFVMGTVFFCIVFLVPNNNIILANKVGDFLGKISYSLYLLHVPIITKVNEFHIPVELKLLLSSFFSVGLAFLSYRYFENPIGKRIRDIASNKPLKREK